MHPVVRIILQGISSFTRYGKAHFDGNGDSVVVGTISDINFLHQLGTTGKWTIEMKIAATNFFATRYLLDTANSTSDNHGISVLLYSDRSFRVMVYRGVDSSLVIDYRSSAGTYPNDTDQHHVEICYDQSLASGNIQIFVDGTSIGTGTKTADTPSSSNAYQALRFGDYNGSVEAFLGNSWGFRITNGRIRNTATYTPPSYFTVDGGDVVVCLNFGEAIGATTFADETGKTVTTNGNVIIIA